jgi:DNA-binding MarR family transcriptional regulator
VARRHSEEDRREVLIELTPRGEEILRQLSLLHWQELQTTGPTLLEALGRIVKPALPNKKSA